MVAQFPRSTYISGASLDPAQSNPLTVQVDVFTDAACTTAATGLTDVYTGDALTELTIDTNELQYFDYAGSETTLYIRATDSTGVGFAVYAQPVLHPLMTLAQLEQRITVDDDALAQQGLEDGSALIREATLNPYIWPKAPGGVPNVVQVILARAVARWLNNPDELQSESFGSYSYTYGKEATTGIWLTDAEIKQIIRAAGAGLPKSVKLDSPYEDRFCRRY
jgi:hypothetical protein